MNSGGAALTQAGFAHFILIAIRFEVSPVRVLPGPFNGRFADADCHSSTAGRSFYFPSLPVRGCQISQMDVAAAAFANELVSNFAAATM